MPSPRPASLHATPISAVATLVGGTVRGEDVLVSGVTLASQDVVPGDLYAALPGANAHGARYAAAALEAGAVAVLTDSEGLDLLVADGVTAPTVVVEGPRSVVGPVARTLYGTSELGLRLFGVTGTNGKTTTAYLMDSALTALGQTTGLIGTVETRIGDERLRSLRTTPEATVLHALLAVMQERGVDSCVMEVSSHALTQHRVDGVVYDVALFTNLSQDHLDFHPTMRDYFLAKASLFTPQRSRRGIVCVDDEWGRELATIAGVPVTTMTSLADVEADWHLVAEAAPPAGGSDDASDGASRGASNHDPADFTLSDGSTTLQLRSALPGEFNRVNTAMAALALLASGLDAPTVERALRSDPHVPGRMEKVSLDPATDGGEHPSLPLVVVDYAHTADAVAAALKALRPQTTGALVVVLGAGGDRDRGKRAAMGRAAALGADVVVVTDDNPRSEDPAVIREAVLAGARDAAGEGGTTDLHDVDGRAAAIDTAVRVAHERGPGSVVAVVGKGHETGQDVAGTIHPFDDREEVARALRAVATGTRGSL